MMREPITINKVLNRLRTGEVAAMPATDLALVRCTADDAVGRLRAPRR